MRGVSVTSLPDLIPDAQTTEEQFLHPIFVHDQDERVDILDCSKGEGLVTLN